MSSDGRLVNLNNSLSILYATRYFFMLFKSYYKGGMKTFAESIFNLGEASDLNMLVFRRWKYMSRGQYHC